MLTISLLLLAGLPVLANHAAAQDRPTESVAAVVPDSTLPGAGIVLRVDGMSCPFCAYGLEKRLQNLPAVDTTVVRVSDGVILIRTKPGHELTDQTIAEAVRRSGFSLREIQRRTD